MKRLLVVLLILSVVASSLFAGSRFLVGAAFNYDAGMLPSHVKEEFEGLEGIYNNGNISGLQAVGPKFELIVFPFGNLPIGVGINSVTMLTVGYTAAGGDAVGYFSRNSDFREDLGVNIYYQQAFSPRWGLFADLGFSYSWYRIATTNEQNSRLPVDFRWATSYGLNADFGAYLEHSNSYFKAGAALYYDLAKPKAMNFRIGLTLGGGFHFG